ncbi:MAG: metal-dependent hydrolase [Stenotrophomonas sp.]
MSSLLGHISVGVAAYLCCNRLSDLRALRTMPLFVLLAVCPDFDYFAVWLLHYSATPRITHTLLFALASSLAAWWCTASWREAGNAGCSGLAGIRGLVFWPATLSEYKAPKLLLLFNTAPSTHPVPRNGKQTHPGTS